MTPGSTRKSPRACARLASPSATRTPPPRPDDAPHAAWSAEEAAASRRPHRTAACQSDAADWPLWDAVTADMVYVRLHGHDITYASGYSESQLREWATKIPRR